MKRTKFQKLFLYLFGLGITYFLGETSETVTGWIPFAVVVYLFIASDILTHQFWKGKG